MTKINTLFRLLTSLYLLGLAFWMGLTKEWASGAYFLLLYQITRPNQEELSHLLTKRER